MERINTVLGINKYEYTYLDGAISAKYIKIYSQSIVDTLHHLISVPINYVTNFGREA